MSSKAGGGVEEQEGDVPSQIRDTKRLSWFFVCFFFVCIRVKVEFNEKA